MNLLRQAPAEVTALIAALLLSPDPVFVTDRHNRIVSWNHSAGRLLGYDASEIVGRSCADVLGGCDASGNRYCGDTCPVTQIAARGEVVRHFDLSFRARDNREVAVDVSILNLTVHPPDQFYLAHILKPAARRLPAEAAARDSAESPPRPVLSLIRSSPDARARKLTAREVEVLAMLAAGHQAPEIALRLHISRLTARNHVQNILDKLEVHSKAEAVAFAFRKQIL